MTTDMRPAKTQRLNVRATVRQEALLRRAAEATDSSLTEFIMSSAVEQAERVLADRRWFAVSEEQFDEFVRLTEEPLATPKFDVMFAQPSRFDVHVE